VHPRQPHRAAPHLAPDEAAHVQAVRDAVPVPGTAGRAAGAERIRAAAGAGEETNHETTMKQAEQIPVKCLDYDPQSYGNLGDSYPWGEYAVVVEMPDGTERYGWMQGDTHAWAFETFEES